MQSTEIMAQFHTETVGKPELQQYLFKKITFNADVSTFVDLIEVNNCVFSIWMCDQSYVYNTSFCGWFILTKCS